MSRPERAPELVKDFIDDSYRRYGKALHGYLRKRLRRRADADDLAQEVFTQLLRIDPDKLILNPQAYLYGIAGHVLSQFRLRETRELERIEFTSEPPEAHEPPPENPLEDEHAERLGLQQQLQSAFAQLPPMHTEVFLFIKRDGLTYAETAKRTGLTVKAVERHFCEAKARLAMLSWDR